VDGEQQQKQWSVWSLFANGVRAAWGRHDKARNPKDSKHLEDGEFVCPPLYSDDTWANIKKFFFLEAKKNFTVKVGTEEEKGKKESHKQSKK